MKIDSINFRSKKINFPVTSTKNIELKTLEIFINNKNLINILREIELPYAQAEKHSQIAGGYQGLSIGHTDIENHFVGKPIPLYQYENRTQILECKGCGEPGCWPMLVKIVIDQDKVIWDDFQQPHRKDWKYDLKFVFDKQQYLSELSKIKK